MNDPAEILASIRDSVAGARLTTAVDSNTDLALDDIERLVGRLERVFIKNVREIHAETNGALVAQVADLKSELAIVRAALRVAHSNLALVRGR